MSIDKLMRKCYYFKCLSLDMLIAFPRNETYRKAVKDSFSIRFIFLHTIDITPFYKLVIMHGEYPKDHNNNKCDSYVYCLSIIFLLEPTNSGIGLCYFEVYQ